MRRLRWLVLTFVLVDAQTTLGQTQARLFELAQQKRAADFKTALSRQPQMAKAAEGLPLAAQVAMTECVNCLRALLDADVSANLAEPRDRRRTLLHFAAGWSTLQMVQLLVERGANVNARTDREDSVLNFAMNNFLNDNTQERAKIVAYLRSRGAK